MNPQIIKNNLSVFVGLAAFQTIYAGQVQLPKQKPNLLIIHTDEQSFRSLSCYRNCWPEANTPNIDKLAQAGVRFENFYTNHPVSTPSRAALLTGQYAHEVQSYLNDVPMSEDAVTLAHILKKHGYATGYVGKWHLNGDAKPGFHPIQNFGFDDNRYMFNRGHWKQIIEKNGIPQVKNYTEIGNQESYTTDFLSRKTIEFIQLNKGKSWCHMLSIPDPHGPDVDRSPYNEMYNPKDVSVPESFFLEEYKKPKWASEQRGKNDPESEFRHTKARYLGMVKHIDDCIGNIMKSLEDTKQIDNTVIVFTSDHGDMMGEFGRYNKGIPLEASAKIAHIIVYPPQIKKGSVVDKIVSNIDFLPTILDLMNIDYPNTCFRGQSALPLIKKVSEKEWKNVAFISLDKLVSIVTPNYKLIYSEEEKPWLYDLNKDPNELTNYFNDATYYQIIKELTLRLKDYLISTNDPNWTGKIGEFQRLRNEKVKEKTEFHSLKQIIDEYSK